MTFNKTWMILSGLAGGFLLLGCVLVVVAVTWLFPVFSSAAIGTDGLEPLQVTLAPSPVIERTPVPPPAPVDAAGEGGLASPIQLSTEQQLLQTMRPERDQRLLAMRLKHGGLVIPEVIPARVPPYQLGDTDTFWVTDNQQIPSRQFQAEARLEYITPHSYWWVADGFEVEPAALLRSAERFELETYPRNREFFGSEWSPGIDSDVRVHIFMGDVPGVAGYFSASNEYSRLAEPYSNEREMFFINLRAILPGNDYFDSVLAHEFQHMIHWYQDRNEDTWVNEGFSELATFINGYGASSFISAYTAVPDTQLTGWANSPGESVPHYGGSFLFMAYFLQRYGEDLTQAVVARDEGGIAGFNAVLAAQGLPERFNDIFADFLVANYLDDPAARQGEWGYQELSLGPLALAERYSIYPSEQRATVQQFGADYVELTGRDNVTVDFTGSTRVKVVNNEAYSGSYQWYSHRGDDTNTRLTRAFDLTEVPTATLRYWTWYDIETDWDYGYVEVSIDGGQTWTILSTPHTSTTNPSGNAYGPGYTGTSGGGPAWIEESIDLSVYAGRGILVRFEYVTDDAVNRPGWTIDDISIPEIGFYDDVEAGPGEWQAEGFVRMDNVLPQRFLVQVLELGDTVEVKTMTLNETNRGALTIEGLGTRLDQAVLIISGLTPVTSESASYEYRLLP